MRILIFGTMWVDSVHREELLKRWIDLHTYLNPGAHFLLVDGGGSTWPVRNVIPPKVNYLTFTDDIGCAARGGKDGWGRAFTTGLQYAIDNNYDYVVHIEGDSLLRRSVGPIIQKMAHEGIDVASIPVRGTKYPEKNWVETGLMFFRTMFVADIDLIRRYDWPTLKRYPVTSESVLHELLHNNLHMLSLNGYRNDTRDLTPENVAERNIDWITHSWEDLAIYDRWLLTIPRRVPA